MYILAFESSCDETSAAVVLANEDGTKIDLLSNIIASSVDLHAEFGGVVPEIASRAHIEAISHITYKALKEAKITMDDVTCIGVTSEPGLVGALLVAVNFAKSLASSYNIPLVPVHHIKGHIAANYLSKNPPKPPYTALVVSGGHTSLIDVKSYTEMTTVGRTRDDAAGESFDKIGRVLGLRYPAGAELDKLAYKGDEKAYKLPSAAMKDGSYDFSFSGLKTSVTNLIHNTKAKGQEVSVEDISASFTKTVCDSIVKKLNDMYESGGMKSLVLAGGVSANSHLRRAVGEFCDEHGIELFVPPLSLCGDNAGMIAAQAVYEYLNSNIAKSDLNARATAPF